MDITPSSSRALRQRLWNLFNIYSSIEADVNSEGSQNPVPSLTKGGFRTCVDALIHRGTFRGLFIGSEDDDAIQRAATQLQSSTTQDMLWKNAVAYENGNSRRLTQQQTSTVSFSNPYASNDHFAEDDFFGEACYRAGGSPNGKLMQASPDCGNTFTDQFAAGTASVPWSAFYTAIVLYLFDQHRFVHSFLAAEIAALRCPGPSQQPVGEEDVTKREKKQVNQTTVPIAKAAPSSPGKAKRSATPTKQATPDRLRLRLQPVHISSPRRKEDGREECVQYGSAHGTSDISPQLNASFATAKLTPPRIGVRKTSIATAAEGLVREEQGKQGLPARNVIVTERRQIFSVESTKLLVASPDTYVPTRRVQAKVISPRSNRNLSADAFSKPAPPPLRKHTQREAAELSGQRNNDSPYEALLTSHDETSAAATATTNLAADPETLRPDGPALLYLQNVPRHARYAETQARTPYTPPVVSCPSVSVSSSSSCGQPGESFATAVAAPVVVPVIEVCPRGRITSISPPPQRPGDTEEENKEKNESQACAAVNPALPTSDPQPVGALRQRSSSEMNAAQAAVKAKADQPARKSGEKNGNSIPETNSVTNSKATKPVAVATTSTAVVDVKRPKLACAGNKPRGQRRVYTTRRPHVAEQSDKNSIGTDAAAPITTNGNTSLGVTLGSCLLLGFAQQRPALAEAWTGQQCKPSPDFPPLPPPTTRNDDVGVSPGRTSSPSPCIPPYVREGLAVTAVPHSSGSSCSRRGGTVEHLVEGRRTTALQVQVFEGMATSADRAVGWSTSSLQPQGVRYASPEKSLHPPAPPQDEQQLPSAHEALWAGEAEKAAETHWDEGETQPPTQTSRRRNDQQPLASLQLSPFSTTREPFAPASQTWSRCVGTTQNTAAQPSSPTATMRTVQQEQPRGNGNANRQAKAVPPVTAPWPTPTSRDERSDDTTRSPVFPSPFSMANVDVTTQDTKPIVPTARPQPPPMSVQALTKQSQQQTHQRPQSIRAPSPPLLIGVPRILASNMISSPRHDSSRKERERHSDATRNATVIVAATHADPSPADMDVLTTEDRCESNVDTRTLPLHWSPDAATEVQFQTPVNLLSPVVRQHLLTPPSLLTTPQRTPQQQRQQQQVEVTTPPPRLSHRARVRSNGRGGRAVPTPPRVPQTRAQLSPSGSLQLTPRRRAPSTSSLLEI